MSPSKQKRPTKKKGKGSGSKGSGGLLAPLQRLGLLVFGLLLVGLFVGFAVAEGLGEPNVPSGDVAVVEDAPPGLGNISKADFQRSLAQTAARSGIKKVPKPGDPQYDDLKNAALGDLLDTVWIQGEAEEMGITVSEQQVKQQFKQIKKQNFKTEAQYKKFLKSSHFTQADVNERVRLQLLTQEIQTRITSDVPKPSSDEISDYYAAAKSQFTQLASRDVRLVLNKDKKKVQQALAALKKDDSVASWRKVAKKYSTDPSSKSNGGLRPGLTNGLVEEPLNSEIFKAPKGQLEGPVKTTLGWYVFEVVKETPERVQPLSEVQSQISSQLQQQAQQEAFTQFVDDYGSKWQSRTFCAPGYVMERCANFKPGGHPPTAPPTCYEANPKGGRPDACPAPVLQLTPALPGTISLVTPQGQRMPQRPIPGPATSPTSTLPGGLPPGVTPPPGG